MPIPRRRLSTALAATGAALAMSLAPLAATASTDQPRTSSAAGSAALVGGQRELTETTRLSDRRSLVLGDRFWQVGAEDGTYPAQGWHVTGEMGGFWSFPIKLLDGLWFQLDGTWLKARSYTSGYGYSRMDLGSHDGVSVSRTDVAPDGRRAGLIGLTFRSDQARTVRLRVDAHSELMGSYPWGWTTPSQKEVNLQDTVSVTGRTLVFREQDTPPGANQTSHDWAATVSSTLDPVATSTTGPHRGPQGSVRCPVPDDDTATCDDSVYGRGAGGSMTYDLQLPVGSRTVWFAVSGSDQGLEEAHAERDAVLAHPNGLLARKIAARAELAARSEVSLPGDRELERSIAWSKQNLADSQQEARDLQLRATHEGTVYPAPAGTLSKVRWTGAGWPDYAWIFATDGEYSAFPLVATGQTEAAKEHLRTLRRISQVINGSTGKVIHEVTPDGSVYYGANADDGNTDESVKFPSAVALVWRWSGDDAFLDEMYPFTVRTMRYVSSTLDADHDGWPEGAGNVERDGMGEEKLDNAVYTIRGMLDLADLAAHRGDGATEKWARGQAAWLQNRFEQTWWYGQDGARSYADSLTGPRNTKVFQRFWTGMTPVEAELPAHDGRPAGPVADRPHAVTTLAQHENPCYTGEYGLFHTGSGPTSAGSGNPGPSCDSVVSTVGSERSVFTLGTSIAAVAESAVGRTKQAQRYTSMLSAVQLDSSVWETPGAMPEIVPSPDFTANINRPWTGRSMAVQAWGTYGVIWPVVHHQLGIAPDLGNGRISVVPRVPAGQDRVAVRNVRLGRGALAVTATRASDRLVTEVTSSTGARLIVGGVLPAGTIATQVTVNGVAVSSRSVDTARGNQVTVTLPRTTTAARVVIGYR